jgi:hypothetical protein
VSQAYVIATSTKVDISSVSIPESVNDAYFAKAKAAKSTKEGEFFGEGKEKKAFPEEKKSEQKVGSSSPRTLSRLWLQADISKVCRLCPSFRHLQGRAPEPLPQGVLGSLQGRPLPRAQVLGM